MAGCVHAWVSGRRLTASEFVLRGDFDFAGEGDKHVRVGSTTGTVGQKLVFDALRVTPLSGRRSARTAEVMLRIRQQPWCQHL